MVDSAPSADAPSADGADRVRRDAGKTGGQCCRMGTVRVAALSAGLAVLLSTASDMGESQADRLFSCAGGFFAAKNGEHRLGPGAAAAAAVRVAKRPAARLDVWLNSFCTK